MTSRAVTELIATRRYITNVLLYLSVDADHLTLKTFIELLDHFADNPTEYLELINDQSL